MQVKFMGATWPSLSCFIGELLGALSIPALFVVFVFGYYAYTGHPLDFGGR